MWRAALLALRERERERERERKVSWFLIEYIMTSGTNKINRQLSDYII